MRSDSQFSRLQTLVGSSDSSSHWVPATHIAALDWVFGCRLHPQQPCPFLATANIWRVSLWVETLLFIPSLFFSNNYKNNFPKNQITQIDILSKTCRWQIRIWKDDHCQSLGECKLTSMRCQDVSTRLAKIKKTDHTKCWWGSGSLL